MTANSAGVFRTQIWVASGDRVDYAYAKPWEWDEVRHAVVPSYRHVASLISAVFTWLTWLGEPVIVGVHARWTSGGTAALLGPTFQAAAVVVLIGVVGLAARMLPHLAGGRRFAAATVEGTGTPGERLAVVDLPADFANSSVFPWWRAHMRRTWLNAALCLVLGVPVMVAVMRTADGADISTACIAATVWVVAITLAHWGIGALRHMWLVRRGRAVAVRVTPPTGGLWA